MQCAPGNRGMQKKLRRGTIFAAWRKVSLPSYLLLHVLLTDL